ncbi:MULTISPECIES: GTPase HflX [unclassified Arcicella]|uniref:GTPase HflX n=1 Tax=unclassified Arcicella TaxID=2644986 RepID=UPI002862CEB2|nr:MULTISPECIES: GTPase HflX [unclassified Arcicella]MDR6564276.1 GTP-binding protein HflX [Arcicella sp. BE51]MDR6811477.1 GTP-binding protein HflX [Arcicella sp. BE140]MDR6826017.1 GTP-binding protein HflX [Arcicella sp. BE139]
MHTTEEVKETAVLVAVQTQKQTAEQTKEYLDELAFLADTSQINTLYTFTQKLEKPDTRTYVGKGKMQDIIAYVVDNDVDMVIFDDDLSPVQIRNIETEFAKFQHEVKILDRSLLILNIFAMRAKTVQAKTQVELAQQQYILPRLTRMWTHLSKQRGGVGMRGPGEKELETDRRIANDRIVFLKEKLKQIDKQAFTQRKNRDRMVRVSLVGYTNVGKSTLMRRLAKAEVFAENKLFATVDATVRKVTFDTIPFLLSDTVGFIRKLPTMLIESFKSTLDEVREADILLHVVDISHPNYEEHIEVVNSTLTEIGAADKPTILVFNKIDLFSSEEVLINDWEIGSGNEPENQQSRIEKVTAFLKNSYMNNPQPQTVFISAEQKENIEELRETIVKAVKEKHILIFPNWLNEVHYSTEELEEEEE